jgi:hypothetical protein
MPFAAATFARVASGRAGAVLGRAAGIPGRAGESGFGYGGPDTFYVEISLMVWCGERNGRVASSASPGLSRPRAL